MAEQIRPGMIDYHTGMSARLKPAFAGSYPTLQIGETYRVLRFEELTPGMHIKVSPDQWEHVLRMHFDIVPGIETDVQRRQRHHG